MVSGAPAGRGQPRRPHDRQLFDARDDRDLLAVARDGGRAALRRAREKDLPLRLPGNLETIPGALGDFHAHAREARVAAEQPFAERQPETLDLGARMLAGGGMDQALQRLAGKKTRQPSVNEGLGEVSFETAGDGQVAGVVTIAAADDSEHAEVRLAMAARADTKHGGTITYG